MKIILVRHTRVDVPSGTCYGHSDVALASTFKQEAKEVKDRLSAFGAFQQVYSSPLSRAIKLALYCGYSPITDNRLIEMNMGEWEMHRFDEINDTKLQEWYTDYINVSPSGGESFMQMYNRVGFFLDDLRQKDFEKVLIFAHGGTLLCAGIYANLFSFDNFLSYLPSFGGMINIELY